MNCERKKTYLAVFLSARNSVKSAQKSCIVCGYQCQILENIIKFYLNYLIIFIYRLMQKIVFKKIGIESYRPGRSLLKKRSKVIKLSANESALGCSSRIKKIISKTKKIFRYPDSKSKILRKEISKKYNCNFNQVICGSGSDEIIQMLCQLFLNKSDEVIVPKYSFLMYRIYSKIVGAKVILLTKSILKYQLNK